MYQSNLFSFAAFFCFATFLAQDGFNGIPSSETSQEETVFVQEEEAEEEESALALEDLAGKWTVKTTSVGERNLETEKGMLMGIEFSDEMAIINFGEDDEEHFQKMRIEFNNKTTPVQITFIRVKDGRDEKLPCIIELQEEGTMRMGLPLVPVKFEDGMRLVHPLSFDDEHPFVLISATKEEAQN